MRFALLDVVKQSSSPAMTYTVTPQQFRATAHKIADVIYEKLTGDAGVFSTRIAYITKQGSRFELIVADADGGNPQAVVASNEPLLSPAWSPDGTRLAYVSLENKKPVVYVQSLASGARQVVANFRGSNSAPAWSPDGRRLVVTLTKDGGSQLFMINADGSGVTRLLTFARDRYRGVVHARRPVDPVRVRSRRHAADLPAHSRDQAVERMTFEGNWNVSPRATPDGKGFVFVRRDGGRFMIAIQDYATRQVQMLTSGPLDESPSIAPNSKLIIYAAQQGGAWYIGRRVLRRSRQAAARLARRRCARARLGPAAALTVPESPPASTVIHRGDTNMRKWIIVAFAIGAARRLREQRHEKPAPVEDKARRRQRRPAPGATTSGAPANGRQRNRRRPSAAALRDPNNILSKRSIYFDFDEYAIKDQYRPMIEAHAKYLQANRIAQVTLQGNTDERGTREYNIALGQKRADAVKKLMVLLGAHRDPDRDGELRQGKAAARRPRRGGVGGESPRRHRVCGRVRARSRIARFRRVRCVARVARVALPARAALFDDDEARKRIEATNQRLTQIQRQLEDRIAGARSAAEEPGPGRALQPARADQGRPRAAARADRGADLRAGAAAKAPARPLRRPRFAAAQARRRSWRAAPPARRRRRRAAAAAPPSGPLAPRAAPAVRVRRARRPSGAPPLRRAEQRAYDAALDQFKAGSYAPAIASFARVRQDVPEEPARALGAILDRQRAVRAAAIIARAIASQRQLIAMYPDSAKVPDALLNIATAQFELGDSAASRRTLEELIAKYPQSEAAAKARQRLGVR